MKHVYFVRHGQTLKNAQHIHQGPEEPLTELGKKQAAAVALVLKEKNIDALVTSTYTRAVETAGIIGQELELPFVQTESVKEFRRPDPLYGHSHFSLQTMWYVWQLFWNRNNPTWDNHGAENMFHIRNRIIDAKRLLSQVEGERIVVVSHAIFIDMFVQAVCADRTLGFYEFVAAFFGAKSLPNTAIVAFQLDENAPPETCAWWLLKEETDRQYLRYR